MNDYERRQAEELAEQAYPSRPFYETGISPWPQSFRNAFIEGYEAALETVAPTQEGTAEEAERLLNAAMVQRKAEPMLDPIPYSNGVSRSAVPYVEYRFEPREIYSQDRKDYA